MLLGQGKFAEAATRECVGVRKSNFQRVGPDPSDANLLGHKESAEAKALLTPQMFVYWHFKTCSVPYGGPGAKDS
jgi:hypothetical protein